MSFRRKRPRLSAIPVSLLAAELRRRGFDVLPAGVWELLQERAHWAESRPASGTVPADSSEVAEVIDQLCHIARVEFPGAVEEIRELHIANVRLRAEAVRSEREASTLATALLYGDPESTHDDDED